MTDARHEHGASQARAGSYSLGATHAPCASLPRSCIASPDNTRGHQRKGFTWAHAACPVVAGLLACAFFGGAAQAATAPGFKDLTLGMPLSAAKKARQLTCTRTVHTVSLPASTVPASRALRTRAEELRTRAWGGDTGCAARKTDTVGGMRIAEL